MGGIRAFLAELRRRQVFRVAAWYGASAWLLIQIASTVAPQYELPLWTVRAVIGAAVLGFPVALLLAWAFEVTLEGVRRTEAAAPDDPKLMQPAWRGYSLWFALAAGALLAVGSQQAWRAIVPADLGSAQDRKSIAVLPFENVSSDPENEYFADGLHDELLTKLAKIHDLKVISRTSVMDYKGKSPDGTTRNLRDIGQALGVATILEGTVRKSGNRVRLSVQLIDAETDAHLWAETFERELTDVFQIQAAVAEEITRHLEATLSVDERAALDTQPTANAEAYELYLRAQLLEPNWVGPHSPAIGKTLALMDGAVALDPDFAEAHALLAASHMSAYWYLPNERKAAHLVAAKSAFERAFALQPALPEAFLARGHYRYVQGALDDALLDYDRALALVPNSAFAHVVKGWTLRRLGRWEASMEEFVRAVALDPFNPNVLWGAAFNSNYLHRYAATEKYFDKAVGLAPDKPGWRLTQALYAVDRRGDLALLRALRENEDANLSPITRWSARMALARFERRYDDQAALVIEALPEWFESLDGLPEPRELTQGWIARFKGDRQAARRLAFEAVRALDDALEKAETPTYLASSRAQAALLAEDPAGARTWAEQALVNARKLNDAVRVGDMRASRARVLAWIGERDTPLQELEMLLAGPSDVHAARIAIDPYWSVLHDDSRFKALIAKHRPKD